VSQPPHGVDGARPVAAAAGGVVGVVGVGVAGSTAN
jgi:hypothetical protein